MVFLPVGSSFQFHPPAIVLNYLALSAAPSDVKLKRDTESRSNKLILILNPNSQGGATGKNWKTTYQKIKRFLPNPHRVILTKKADDGTVS